MRGINRVASGAARPGADRGRPAGRARDGAGRGRSRPALAAAGPWYATLMRTTAGRPRVPPHRRSGSAWSAARDPPAAAAPVAAGPVGGRACPTPWWLRAARSSGGRRPWPARVAGVEPRPGPGPGPAAAVAPEGAGPRAWPDRREAVNRAVREELAAPRRRRPHRRARSTCAQPAREGGVNTGNRVLWIAIGAVLTAAGALGVLASLGKLSGLDRTTCSAPRRCGAGTTGAAGRSPRSSWPGCCWRCWALCCCARSCADAAALPMPDLVLPNQPSRPGPGGAGGRGPAGDRSYPAGCGSPAAPCSTR